jgi:serine O-acetyltransferase
LRAGKSPLIIAAEEGAPWSIVATRSRVFRQFREDAVELCRVALGRVDRRGVLETMFGNDSYCILVLWRLRMAARRARIPLVNHLLRRVQTMVFGIELDKDSTIGRGVWFVHPIGTVVGGDACLGDRVKLMGCNTMGTVRDNGYPTIEDDVVVGVGARVLGPIRVGARSLIGANAVVVSDIPPDSVAAGLPARVIRSRLAETSAPPERE